MTEPEDRALSLARARVEFVERGRLPAGAVPQLIERSWRRCAESGLGFGKPARQDPLPSSALRQRRAQHETLLQLATPELDALHRAMLDVGGMVLLTNPDGLILVARGEPGFVGRARRVSLQPGAGWAETEEGTNAVGTALAERMLVEVRGPEHYLEDNAFLICTAMPIIDPHGALAGVIDLSGDVRRPQPQAQALARLAVAHMEHRWARQCEGDLIIGLHPHPGWLGSPQEGVLSFRDGVLQGASSAALDLLQLDRAALGRARLDEIFDGSTEPGERVLRTQQGGRSLHCRIAEPARPARRPVRPAASAVTIERGAVWDEPTRAMRDKAVRALDAGIPVLLHGETGTGKEVFVRAAHAASSRAKAPLVAVNCAAIPDGLLESELFGYEEGAFTGARRGGSKGQIRLADGGVLFLDEIGDMPERLQARLLRVLQDGEVTPVGGRPVRVDFRLVAATHRDLAAAVAEGRFRADLYYRLRHLVLSLPPLRQRQPIDPIIDSLMTGFGAAETGIRLAPAAREALRRHDWPGNLRELANLLRTLVALAAPGTVIGIADLPADMTGSPTGAVPDESDLRALTEEALGRALERHRGNVSAAARALGVHRSTLYRRLGPARRH